MDSLNMFENKKVWSAPSIDDFAVADLTHTFGDEVVDGADGTDRNLPTS
ncbi:MAG: hypothetical protein AAFZ11_12510 [Pseudomonadota bacterium]